MGSNCTLSVLSHYTLLTTWGQMRGKWLGSWKMSKGAEKILHRLIQPNADLRCTAPEALQDPYWDSPLPASGHKRAVVGGARDKSHSRGVISPLSSRRVSKAQQPEREHLEKQDDKENAPVTTTLNSKKGPARQRVLSGTDGEFFFLLGGGSK